MNRKKNILKKKKKCWAIFKLFAKVNLNIIFLSFKFNMLYAINAMQKTNIN